MKKWSVVAILGCAQFVMIVDTTIMNVSIAAVVADLQTTVDAMQGAITFYSLTTAAAILLGVRLGERWGTRRAFVVGCCIYAFGSLVAALSPNIVLLVLGWSVIEGLGAALVIPAIAAAVAENYRGRDRGAAFAAIGVISVAAIASGPLIGGFVTTTSSWRFLFVAGVLIVVSVAVFARFLAGTERPSRTRIDVPSVVLLAACLVLLAVGMLECRIWGWFLPLSPPEIGGVTIAPFGISPTAWLALVEGALIVAFIRRQQRLVLRGRHPLLHLEMFSVRRLRSALSMLGAQHSITGGLFFIVAVYLQMTVGLNALQTGIAIVPLSISLVLFFLVGALLARVWAPRRIVRLGQFFLVAGNLVLLTTVTSELKSIAFTLGMVCLGTALGLLASQLGSVIMSDVTKDDVTGDNADGEAAAELGGVQGLVQGLGSSIGTALIGAILIGTLTASFASGVANSELPARTQTVVAEQTQGNIAIVPATSIPEITHTAGLSPSEAATLAKIYHESQLDALRISFFCFVLIAAFAMVFSRGIPARPPCLRRKRKLA